MKIKVGNTVYDGNEVPVMVILTEDDKDNIKNMPPETTSYCQYPEDKYSEKEIFEWIEETE